MICKEGSRVDIDSKEGMQSQQAAAPIMTSSLPPNGYNTLQHRRKSQLITFSASSSDIKNSLSHELITASGRLSYAEEQQQPAAPATPTASTPTAEQEVYSRRSLEMGEELALQLEEDEEGEEAEAEEQAQEAIEQQQHQQQQQDEEDDEEVEDGLVVEDVEDVLYMHDEFETHIDAKSNNANDDSGGGSYEDSHALHSSLGGSNRNSLEKDDDDIEVDVISTDVSCYDQLLGSSCNTRHGDDDDLATLIGDNDHLVKGQKGHAAATAAANAAAALGKCALEPGSNVGNGNGGIIYANPFMGL
ncbi:PREDICTED: tyrosine-protein phosphatase 10D-like [Drosophila arizonae]|uniref:Tyrosine-protein phosphatase 10D-like n=1 Tax=Drosophila arizonae TaxID=7263 RepID=A0ABM1PQA9_DROAR|nr:PREDICTED: tyrosine-protein phosphatase 10D-like [Drosophila arizonae]